MPSSSGPATDPLVMHSQSATEYWQRRGSLVHTTTRGEDLPQPEAVRIYHWCSSQHAANPLLTKPATGPFLNTENVVWTSMLFRALLDAMDAWATAGTPPPPSAMPRRADGTAATMDEWRGQFPAIPGIATPRGPSDFPLYDFGLEAGVQSILPPRVADAAGYAVLVPAVDADGNDLGGVRAPMVAAPLATYTAWNLRARGNAAGALHEYTGSTIPFAETEAERAATGDPRPSIAGALRRCRRLCRRHHRGGGGTGRPAPDAGRGHAPRRRGGGAMACAAARMSGSDEGPW